MAIREVTAWIARAGLAVLALRGGVQARAPEEVHRDPPGARIDFADTLDRLTSGLNDVIAVSDLSEAAPGRLLQRPEFAGALARRQFIAKVGAKELDAFFTGDPASAAFLVWVLQDTSALENCLEGATPVPLARRSEDTWTIPVAALAIWRDIWRADPESRAGLYLRLAIATGLSPPGTGNQGAGQAAKPPEPLARYQHYKEAHRNGELFPTFDALTVWDLRQIVSSNASNEDLAWGRALVNTWVPQMKAGQKVVDTTSLVWRRNSPIPFDNTFKNVLAGGGKCGPRSSWAVFICQAWGIPAIGLAQPAHAAVGYKDVDGRWQTGYGRGWAASRTSFGSGNEFIEGMEQRLQTEKFMMIERLRWLASALASKERAARVMEVAVAYAQRPAPESAKSAEPAPSEAAAARPEPPVNVPPGVIHIPAASFERDGGITVWGGHPGVVRVDSPGGGRQAFFQGALASAWAGYRITVPQAGVYELTARVAAGNTDQSLYVRSYGAMLPVRGTSAQHVYRDNQKDFGPHLLVDHDPGTRWSANEGNDQCWVELDLGRPERISTVLIDERAWNRVTKFNFQYQAGDAWKTIFEGTDIGIDFARDFDPVTAQRIRLNVLDTREQMGFGPTLWELSVGTVPDGRAWIKVPLTHGLWGVTDPVDLKLVAGEQLVWVFAPFQRGVAVKWFQLKPKPAGTRAVATAARPVIAAPEQEEADSPSP